MLVADSLQNRSAAYPGLAHGPHAASLAFPADPPYRFAVIPTSWGLCGAVWSVRSNDADLSFTFSEKSADSRLCRILTPGLSCHDLRKNLLHSHPRSFEVMGDPHGNFHPEVVPDWFPHLVRYLQSYYATASHHRVQPHHSDQWSFWTPRLDWSSRTPFQRRVLECVAQIPSGQCRTYGQIARSIGKPNASRAVGAALRSNPWPVLVPCHRVLGASGKLTGFTAPGGIHTKQKMLDLESAPRG